ncbi:MAG: hypothetical protein JXA69_00680 [Phycisphaerae bacterium]|nr:hypothetical protein [Phycisphaerae bacterium]
MKTWKCLAVGAALLAATGVALAQQDLGERPLPIHEVLFSIEEPPPNALTEATDAADPTLLPPTHRDLLSERGYVVAPIRYLLRNFRPAPTYVAVDHGLDAIEEVRLVNNTTARPNYLLSVEKGFFDTGLGQWISDGDLLCDVGKVVATNAQLMRNFRPMPPTPPVGLDAVCIHRFHRPIDIDVDVNAEPERHPVIWFSTEVHFFDERLGVRISDGDLLSTTGRIVATNRWLLRNFRPRPTPDGTMPDLGLDAAFVPRFNARLHSEDRPPVIWFSTERGFFDERLGRFVSDGDLLSTTGQIVRTNWRLMRNFREPDPAAVVPPNVGLDAVHVRTRLPDYNLDGAVDLSDFGVFVQCFNGPNRPIADACADVDLDDDGDVDLSDFRQFQAEFTGPIAADASDE